MRPIGRQRGFIEVVPPWVAEHTDWPAHTVAAAAYQACRPRSAPDTTEHVTAPPRPGNSPGQTVARVLSQNAGCPCLASASTGGLACPRLRSESRRALIDRTPPPWPRSPVRPLGRRAGAVARSRPCPRRRGSGVVRPFADVRPVDHCRDMLGGAGVRRGSSGRTPLDFRTVANAIDPAIEDRRRRIILRSSRHSM